MSELENDKAFSVWSALFFFKMEYLLHGVILAQMVNKASLAC